MVEKVFAHIFYLDINCSFEYKNIWYIISNIKYFIFENKAIRVFKFQVFSVYFRNAATVSALKCTTRTKMPELEAENEKDRSKEARFFRLAIARNCEREDARTKDQFRAHETLCYPSGCAPPNAGNTFPWYDVWYRELWNILVVRGAARIHKYA